MMKIIHIMNFTLRRIHWL